MKLLALHGDSGCGKNTIADLMHYPQIAFATPLRLYVYSKFDYDLTKLGDKEYEADFADIFCQVSPEFHAIHPGLLMQLSVYDILSTRSSVVVVTDLRRADELLWLETVGATMVHLVRESDRKLQPMDQLLDRSLMQRWENKGDPVQVAANLKRFVLGYGATANLPIKSRVRLQLQAMLKRVKADDPKFFSAINSYYNLIDFEL